MSEELKPCPPVLVRDLAEILGRAVPDVMSAFIVAGLAPHSPNMAVSGEDALAVAAVLKQQRQDCEPVAYLYHDASAPKDAHPWLNSTMLVLAADRRQGLRGETPLYAAPPKREPLSDEQIEQGRKQTFSTENPFCPCDSKTMRKAVRWAERAHKIGGQS